MAVMKKKTKAKRAAKEPDTNKVTARPHLKELPSTHGSNTGKDNRGQFVEGNRCSVGNKGNTNTKSSELKQALLLAVTTKDIKAIVKKLVLKAKKDGDVPAAKELFDRIWGRAKQEVDIGAKDDLKSFIDWLVDRNDDSTDTS